MKKNPEIKHKVLVRFTEEEYALMKENVAKSRLFIQNYFRMLIKGIRPTEKPGDDFYAVHYSQMKILENLSQIAGKADRLNMPEQYEMRNIAQAFSDHCTKILHMMLRFDKP